MNTNIQSLTKKHTPHKSIRSIRIFEDLGEKFMVSTENRKYVQTDSDTNLFCGVFLRKDGSRQFNILNLREVIRLQMTYGEKRDTWVNGYKKECAEKLEFVDRKFLFMLSPGDVVYVPTTQEQKTGKKLYYVVNDFTGSHFYFRPVNHALAIHEKEVDMQPKKYNTDTKNPGSYGDKTASIDGKMIKEICIPVTVDRLGKIISQSND